MPQGNCSEWLVLMMILGDELGDDDGELGDDEIDEYYGLADVNDVL